MLIINSCMLVTSDIVEDLLQKPQVKNLGLLIYSHLIVMCRSVLLGNLSGNSYLGLHLCHGQELMNSELLRIMVQNGLLWSGLFLPAIIA